MIHSSSAASHLQIDLRAGFDKQRHTICTSHVTHHTSHTTRHTSHVTSQTSHITHHTSKVTRHTSLACLMPHTCTMQYRAAVGRERTRITASLCAHASHSIQNTLHITHHASHKSSNTSHITHHASHTHSSTSHTSFAHHLQEQLQRGKRPRRRRRVQGQHLGKQLEPKIGSEKCSGMPRHAPAADQPVC